MDSHETRISSLESWKSTIDEWRTNVAVSIGKQELDKEYIKQKFQEIDDELKDIKKILRNVNYTVWAAVAAYIIKFAMNGGFTNPAL